MSCWKRWSGFWPMNPRRSWIWKLMRFQVLQGQAIQAARSFLRNIFQKLGFTERKQLKVCNKYYPQKQFWWLRGFAIWCPRPTQAGWQFHWEIVSHISNSFDNLMKKFALDQHAVVSKTCFVEQSTMVGIWFLKDFFQSSFQIWWSEFLAV